LLICVATCYFLPVDYFVIGADGKEYGPTTVDQIRTWTQEGRVTPQTMLKSFATGQTIPASSVNGLFPTTAPPAAPVFAPPPGQRPQASYAANDDSPGVLVGVIIRSALGIVLFFFLHGIGLFVTGYGLYYAIQAQASGNKYGKIALVIAGLAFAAVGIGWILRMQGRPV
jgi:hypothetical protein